MKIQLLSDLHIEFWARQGIKEQDKLKEFQTDAEVLVLAGDINVGRRNTLETLKYFSDMYPHVVYVRGNHEEYGSRRDVFLEVETFEDKLPDNVHFLEDTSVTIGRIVFIGSPLWTDFHGDPLAEQAASFGIADFHRVNTLKTSDYIFANEIAKASINMHYGLNSGKHKVIVTHFVPAMECVHPRWKQPGDLVLNKYFANNLGKYIAELSDTTWMFGHTHDSCDMLIGDTRMLCNPHGYLGYEQCANFNPTRTYDVLS